MKKTISSLLFTIVLCVSFLSGCILDELSLNDVSFGDFVSQEPAGTPPREEIVPGAAGELTISFLDVGQGDSAFVELPDGKTMLIDAGEAEAGERIVSFIHEKGYRKIDYLIATHPHADHIGGMKAVVQAFEIGEIYMPKASTNTKTYENLLEAISEKGLKIKTAQAGVQICAGVELLAPAGESYEELNNYSAVLRIVNAEHRFLFMGDAEILSEDEILEAGYDVRADVVKVGHHGSGTSSGDAFVEATGARYAIISVGAGNSYNHPHVFVVEKWQAAGAQIFRTDEQGTITVRSDGTELEVTSEK